MSLNSLSIRHGHILLLKGEWLTDDILVRNERRVEIADRIDTNDLDRAIDATGLVLVPGVIDYCH